VALDAEPLGQPRQQLGHPVGGVGEHQVNAAVAAVVPIFTVPLAMM
jgi:hypothetical protein